MPRSPNLIIAGTVKGGTTSLYSYLSRHPEVCAASIKETCFFLPVRYGGLLPSLDTYFCLFRHCVKQRYLMEATPGYFEGGASLAKTLKQQLGTDLKIIVVLRDPVERLKSFFKYKKSMLEIEKNLSFCDYVQCCINMPLNERLKRENDKYWGLDGGYYDKYLDSWLSEYGPHIKVTFFDRLLESPTSWMLEICAWLNIDGSIYESMVLEAENKTVGYKNKYVQELALLGNRAAEKFWRRNPKIKSWLRAHYYKLNGEPYGAEFDDKTLAIVRELYQPHNARLARSLRAVGYTDLPKWLG